MSLLSDNYKGVFDHRLGFGKKPALLVVDFVKAYTTPGSLLYAEPVVQAVAKTKDLIAVARRAAVPVIYTKVLYSRSLLDGGLFVQKIPVLQTMIAGEPLADIVGDLEVQPHDLVLVKQYASAFFGTPLASALTSMQIDTIILAGCSTSGCIRATAIDGMQHGFRVIVPRECVGDRSAGPHEANLFDINAKYGDVVSLGEVVERLTLLGSLLGRSYN
jgi:maleamate amidohydrolase